MIKILKKKYSYLGNIKLFPKKFSIVKNIHAYFLLNLNGYHRMITVNMFSIIKIVGHVNIGKTVRSFVK